LRFGLRLLLRARRCRHAADKRPDRRNNGTENADDG
jgi:hypothetical protein